MVVLMALGHVEFARAQQCCPCPPVTSSSAAAPAGAVYYPAGSYVARPADIPPTLAPTYGQTGGRSAVYLPYTSYRTVAPVAAVPTRYYVGRGILGQPKLYVPGQPLRNFVRYLSP
jgi:hypothetical protein